MRAGAFVCVAVGIGLAFGPGILWGGPAKKAEKDNVPALIKQLGDERFVKRLAASKKLETVGAPALVALRKAAASSDDLEIRRRAEQIIRTITAKLRAAPAELVRIKLGLQLRQISPELVSRVSRQLHGGLEVTTVDAEGAAAKAGIRRGDILVGLHQWEVLNLDNVAYVLIHPDLAKLLPLSYYIVRSGQVRRGSIPNVN